MGQPVAITHPTLRDDLPLYPPLIQALRTTGGTVPGPSGYASSSILGPSLFVAFTQQLDPSTLIPRDCEPCFALDLNRYGLSPGYYTNCRLAGSHQSLPVYEVGGAPVASPAFGMTSPPLPAGQGITPAQVAQLSTLSPSQLATLANLTPCQLLTLLTALPTSQIQTITTGVITATGLATLLNYSTATQFANLYTQLTMSQLIVLTSLSQQTMYGLIQVLTAPQIQTLTATLTTAQLLALATLAPAQIKTVVTNLTTAQLITFLNATTLSPVYPPGTNTQTGTSYTVTIADLGKLITLNNSSPIAITLPSAATFGIGYTTSLQNIGTGTATLTPSSGTINGALSLAITATQGATIVSDGTNWQVSTPVAGATLSASGGPTWTKVASLTYTSFSNPAVSKDVEAYSLPAKGTVLGAVLKTTTAFAGTGVTVVTATLGRTAANYNDIISSYDAFAAVSNTNFNYNSGTGTGVYNFGSTTSVRVKLTCNVNLNNLTAGVIDVYLLLGTLP